MAFDLAEYLGGLKRKSKSDPIPGTHDGDAGRPCPACGKKLLNYKKCCGHENGYIGCQDLSCGYKENI